jgi:hypothetical protein
VEIIDKEGLKVVDSEKEMREQELSRKLGLD